MTSRSHTQDDGYSRQDLLDEGEEALRAAERDAPRRVAEWILLDVIGCDRAELYVHPEARVGSDQVETVLEMIGRYRDGEPLQHVLGYTSFRGLRIAVSPDVMIPRPETEEAVEWALRAIASDERPHVLDIGTGSGCIALAIKHERPDARVQAWDVSEAALSVARENASRLGLDVTFDCVDLFDEGIEKQLDAPVDLLVSNPPYIPASEAEDLSPVVRDYDPDVALYAGDDPVRFYRSIAARVPLLCAVGSAIVLETHSEYAEDAATVLREQGLRDVHVRHDLQGRPRILTARYVPERGE